MTFRLRRWTPVLMVSGGLVVFVSGSWLPGLSGCDGGEVADGNSLVAVRAGPAGADTAAEGSAVVAALPAEVAGLAGRTLVHGALSRRRWRGQTCGQRPGDRGQAAPVSLRLSLRDGIAGPGGLGGGARPQLGRGLEQGAAQVLQQAQAGGGHGQAAPAAGGPVEHGPHQGEAAGLAGQAPDDLDPAAGLAEGAFDEVGVPDAVVVPGGEAQV